MTDSERLQWLANLKANSIHLERDGDHACNYMTAAQWIEECPEDYEDCPPESVAAMKATNTIWRLQIYPNAPVGFKVWFGATAAEAIDAAMRGYAAEVTPQEEK